MLLLLRKLYYIGFILDHVNLSKESRWTLVNFDQLLLSMYFTFENNFFLIGIQSIQGWTVTTKHEATKKRSTKRLRHTGNLFRNNL